MTRKASGMLPLRSSTDELRVRTETLQADALDYIRIG
jgi:hypothetical protein